MPLASRFFAAIASTGATLVVLAGLVTMGIVAAERKREASPALTVIDLAALKGSEDAEAEASEPSEPSAAQPSAATATPPPITPPVVTPLPVPAMVQPAPVAAVQQPTVAAAVLAQPSASTAASSPSSSAAPTAAPAQPALRGVRDGLSADAPPGTSRAYAAKIRSWLLAHKIYPKYARMRRIEGVVRVRFVLDRAGRLLEGALIGSSGEKSLDGEGEAMLRRASPYPAAPADVAGERIAFTVPIEFALVN